MSEMDIIPLTRLKVLIADDHAFFRMGLRSTLEQIAYIRTIDEAANGSEALKLIEKKNYDLIFMDIQMPEVDGIEAVRQIRLKDTRTRIVVLSMHATEKYIMEMYNNNINAYLLKDTDLEEVQRAIENVMDGDTYYNAEVREILFKGLVKKDKIARALSKSEPGTEISDREADVLKLICDQYATSEIATKLYISPNTVKFHRENLLKKTDSKNLAGLVLYAVKFGYYQVS